MQHQWKWQEVNTKEAKEVLRKTNQIRPRNPKKDATECASDKDGDEDDEESEVQFCETVPEQEPSLKDMKDTLLSVQTILKDIQIENRK